MLYSLIESKEFAVVLVFNIFWKQDKLKNRFPVGLKKKSKSQPSLVAFQLM